MAIISFTTLSFLCSLLFLLIIFTYQTNAVYDTVYDKQRLFSYFCDQNNDSGNFTPNSTYHTNLDTLLYTLTSNTEIDYGFYNFSQGQNTNKVNAIGLCRGDVRPNDCRICLDDSRLDLTSLCPNKKEAIIFSKDERCMLRYSNRSIFGLNEIGPAYFMWSLINVTKEDEFDKVVKKLLESLRSIAASGDTRIKYATASAVGPNNQTIYGLVQCTPDLSKPQCDDCLVQSITEIPICCNIRIGARIVRPSCNVRYETSFLFYEPTAAPPPPPPSTTTTNNTSSPGKSNNTTIGIAIAVPVIVVLMVCTFICIYLRVRKPRKRFETQEEEDEDEDEGIAISESLQFNFNTIRNATDDFSDSNKLGQGGFGVVYKGRLYDGQEIAVKRLSRNSGQGDIEFKNEVLLVAKLQHRNLVRLLGFCVERRERLLVYEFVPNKSLDYILFDQTKRAQLDWGKRYKIITSIARGILYLHEDSRLRIIHRDLKASNILLDEEMNPKIADFGMARLFVVDQTQLNTNRIVGTYGYMAPEYAMYGQFSVKSDVFSFGILVLEIVSGHKKSGVHYGDNIEYLSSFAWRNWREGTATNIIDPTLNKDSRNEIMRCIHIGLLCVQENITSRPTMASVVVMLNSHYVTLPIPSEPAFHMDSITGNLLDMQSWGHSSAQESANEASITEPYPR